MKTPKTPSTVEKKKVNTPRSGFIAKRKSMNGTTPKKGDMPPFRGTAHALRMLAQDEENVTPSRGPSEARGDVSPEVELGLKIEAMLKKGVSPQNQTNSKKTPVKQPTTSKGIYMFLLKGDET